VSLRLVGISAIALLLTSPVTQRPFTGSAFSIDHVTVIDGAGSKPDMSVRVRGGRILEVAPSAGSAVETVPSIDGRGKFLIPGLVDTHADVTYLDWIERSGSRSAEYNDEVTRRSLKMLLAFGVTTVRNPAGPTNVAIAIRDRVAAGEIDGPTIYTAGDILDRARAYDGLTRPVETEADVEREVAAQAAAGVDFVKVYANMPRELVAAAIRAAHQHHVRVIGHLQATSWTEAARLGIDAISHGASWAVDELPGPARERYRRAIASGGAMRARLTWLEDVQPDGIEIRAMVRELSARRIPVDPTLIAYATKFLGNDARFVDSADLLLAPPAMRHAFAALSFVRGWTPSDFERGHGTWRKMQALVRAYFDGGVLLTAGSDEPNSWVVPGPSLHTELELLVEAGLSPLQVLTIATRNGAESLGILKEVGTVSAGKRADLLLLDRDPTKDIRSTRAISLVVNRGRVSRPEDILRR
jgi:imidazolonepropionase-like amidohydrolase